MKQINIKSCSTPSVCFLLLWKLAEVKNQQCSPLACVDQKKGPVLLKKMNISVNCVKGGESNSFTFIILYRFLSPFCPETHLTEKRCGKKMQLKMLFLFC